MAKATLPTNYRDDILNVSTEGKRKYRMNYNDDGTVSFVDVTPYDQEGSDFGAGDINRTNEAVNQSFDKSKIIRDMDAINALTQEGFAPDALALKEVSDSLTQLGKRTGIYESGTLALTNVSYKTIKAQFSIPERPTNAIFIPTHFVYCTVGQGDWTYNNGILTIDLYAYKVIDTQNAFIKGFLMYN